MRWAPDILWTILHEPYLFDRVPDRHLSDSLIKIKLQQNLDCRFSRLSFSVKKQKWQLDEVGSGNKRFFVQAIQSNRLGRWTPGH